MTSEYTVPYAGQTDYHQDFGEPRSYDPSTDPAIAVRAAKEAGLINVGGFDPIDEARSAEMAQAIGEGKRAFVSPIYKVAHILAAAGKLMPCFPGTDTPVVAGQATSGGVEMRRVGDVFVDFVGGICILDPADPTDELRILWCEANTQAVRDCMDPQVEQWVAMLDAQQELSTREATMDRSINVDAVLRGDFSGFSKAGSLAARARGILAGKS